MSNAERQELEREIARRAARLTAARGKGFALAQPAGDARDLGRNIAEATVERGAVNGGVSRRAEALDGLKLLLGFDDQGLEDLACLLLLRLEFVETRLNLLDSMASLVAWWLVVVGGEA